MSLGNLREAADYTQLSTIKCWSITMSDFNHVNTMWTAVLFFKRDALGVPEFPPMETVFQSV